MIPSVPERVDMIETLCADGTDGSNMFVLLMREIVEFKIFILSLNPYFMKMSIKDGAIAKLHLEVINGGILG